MRIGDYSTPAVILESRRHGGLGIARSLGRLGVPVYVVDSDRWPPAASSRYQRARFQWDLKTAPAARSVDFLLSLPRKLRSKPVLIATTDETATFIADHSDALRDCFLFHVQPEGLVRALSSKKQMYFLAKKHGVPTAETTFPDCPEDVEEFSRTAQFPVMLKGIDGRRLEERAGSRMFIVHDKEKLAAMYRRFEDPAEPNLMLQEYIPGGASSVWMFNGYFNARSQCLLGITGKKIHQFPAYTGLTSLGVVLQNDVVDSATRSFMQALGYRGILDIGYRYDARDGQYKVLDINPRIGATFRLFLAQNGMDVARAMYLDLTGRPVLTASPLEGRRWFVEDLDLVSSLRYLRDRRLGFREWIRSYRGVQEGAFFAWDDPLPLLHMCVWDCGKLLQVGFGRMFNGSKAL